MLFESNILEIIKHVFSSKAQVSTERSHILNYIYKKRARKSWITQEMISKMDERWKWKNVYTEDSRKNYRRLRNKLK